MRMQAHQKMKPCPEENAHVDMSVCPRGSGRRKETISVSTWCAILIALLHKAHMAWPECGGHALLAHHPSSWGVIASSSNGTRRRFTFEQTHIRRCTTSGTLKYPIHVTA